jgi:tRNA dimethylallyltransferase
MNTSESSSLPKVALIAGPTASGKSGLALALSKLLPVTIINADASQVYRDLRIVSARPSVEEEAQAPHKLFGTWDGGVACSAAEWASEAKTEIEAAHAEGRLPALVGGTGLYIRTLLDGIAPVPPIDPDVRATVRALASREAYQLLTTEDPEAAARLSPNDSSRVARALEVVRSTGRPIKAWHSERVGGIGENVTLCPMILLPPREWLRQRCDARFDTMLKTGGIAEVESLLARNLDPALPVMRAIGVREIAARIADPSGAEKYGAEAKIATRQYAKRQYTWFRNQLPADWTRYDQQLNNDSINELAIILRYMALTS